MSDDRANNTNKPPQMYTVGEILRTNEYIIPMYQRNFAWEDKEILQLIDDVLDFQSKVEDIDSYYIGCLCTITISLAMLACHKL